MVLTPTRCPHYLTTPFCDAHTQYGKTPLIESRKYSRHAVVEVLVRAGAKK
jgi:hypothetical protein